MKESIIKETLGIIIIQSFNQWTKLWYSTIVWMLVRLISNVLSVPEYIYNIFLCVYNDALLIHITCYKKLLRTMFMIVLKFF